MPVVPTPGSCIKWQPTVSQYLTHCIRLVFLPCSLCSVMTHDMPPQMQWTTVVDMLVMGCFWSRTCGLQNESLLIYD